MPLLVIGLITSCGGGTDGATDGGADGAAGGEAMWVGDVGRAAAAVEAELGDGAEFFEITANPQLTNVFVAADGATVALRFVFVDGELLDAGPPLEGASGQTFHAGDIGFAEADVLDAVARELPDAVIEAFSVEGGPGGTVRYVVSARSARGGVLDIEVGADGTILAVDPV